MPGPGLGAGDTVVTKKGMLVASRGDTQQPGKHGTHKNISDTCEGGKGLWGASLGRRQRCEQRLEQPADRDDPGLVLQARQWQGKGPGPGELGVLEEHLRRVWLQWVSERETGSGGGQGPRGQLGGRPELKRL